MHKVALSLVSILLAVPAALRAQDYGIIGTRLVVVDKVAAASKAKAVFVAKDARVTKGAGTDVTQIRATLYVGFDGVMGAFEVPAGPNWVVNDDSGAGYENRLAPAGGSVKVALLVPPRGLLRVNARSLGETPLDISSAPSASVSAVYTVFNEGRRLRNCAKFTGCVHRTIAAGTGYKLSCRGSSTPDPECAAEGCYVDLGTTVLDTCMNLEWEKKQTEVGTGRDPLNPHDVDNVYAWAGTCSLAPDVWCQPNTAASATCSAATGGAPGCAECGMGEGVCDVDGDVLGPVTTVWDWINQVNASPFAGHGDWRLPMMAQFDPPVGDTGELELIVNRGAGTCEGTVFGPCINPVFGPTRLDYYWSGSSHSEDTVRVMGFHSFPLLEATAIPKQDHVAVRAVRTL